MLISVLIVLWSSITVQHTPQYFMVPNINNSYFVMNLQFGEGLSGRLVSALLSSQGKRLSAETLGGAAGWNSWPEALTPWGMGSEG